MAKKPKSLDSSKSKAPTIKQRPQGQTAGMGPVAKFGPTKGQKGNANPVPRANTSTNARRMLPPSQPKHNLPMQFATGTKVSNPAGTGMKKAKSAFNKMQKGRKSKSTR